MLAGFIILCSTMGHLGTCDLDHPFLFPPHPLGRFASEAACRAAGAAAIAAEKKQLTISDVRYVVICMEVFDGQPRAGAEAHQAHQRPA